MELAIRGKNNDYIIHRQQQALLNHYDYPLLKTIFLSTPVALLSRRRELLNLFSADKPVEELARLVLTLIVDRKGPLIELRVLELLKVLPEDVREKVITVMLLSSVDTICKLSKQFDSNNFKRRQSAQRLAENFACICKNRQDPCLFLRVLVRLFEKALLCDRDLWYIRLIFVHAFKAWPFMDSKLFEECINTNQEKFSKANIHILIRNLNDAARDCDNAVRYGILIALNNDQLRNFANSCLLPMATAFMQNPRKSAWAIVTLAITCCLRKDTYLQGSLRRAFETFKRHSTSFVPLQVSEAIVRAKIFLEQNSFIKMDLKIPQHAEYIQLLCKKLETQKLLLSPAAFPLKKSVMEIFNLEYTITENLRSLGLQAPGASVTLHCPTPEISCSSTTVKKEQKISRSPSPKQKRPSIPPDSKRPLSPSPPPKLSRMSSLASPSSPNKPSCPAPESPPSTKCSRTEYDNERTVHEALKSLVHSSMDFTASDIENFCQEVCVMLPSTNEDLLAKHLIQTFMEVCGKEFEWPFIITCLMLTSSGWSSVVKNVVQVLPSFVSTDGQAKSAAEQFGRVAAQLCLQTKQKQLLISFLANVVVNQSPEFLSVCNTAINVWPEVIASCAEDVTSKALALTLWKLTSPEELRVAGVVEESQRIPLANLHTKLTLSYLLISVFNGIEI